MSEPLMPTELELAVRPMNQHGLQATEPGQENRACWYASALMVLNYRGPLAANSMINIHTIARKWRNDGLFPHEFWRLAEEVGLEHANARAVLPKLGAVNWRTALDTLGPLIVTVGAHAVVVRGIVRQGLNWHIVFNDPFVGARRTMVMPRFNANVNWSMPILYRRSAQRPPATGLTPTAHPLGRA